MPGLNFDKLTGPSAADSELHPREIFAALPANRHGMSISATFSGKSSTTGSSSAASVILLSR